MGFYSEENCQTEAHEPLLDWASGWKAPGTTQISNSVSIANISTYDVHIFSLVYELNFCDHVK